MTKTEIALEFFIKTSRAKPRTEMQQILLGWKEPKTTMQKRCLQRFVFVMDCLGDWINKPHLKPQIYAQLKNFHGDLERKMAIIEDLAKGVKASEISKKYSITQMQVYKYNQAMFVINDYASRFCAAEH